MDPNFSPFRAARLVCIITYLYYQFATFSKKVFGSVLSVMELLRNHFLLLVDIFLITIFVIIFPYLCKRENQGNLHWTS